MIIFIKENELVTEDKSLTSLETVEHMLNVEGFQEIEVPDTDMPWVYKLSDFTKTNGVFVYTPQVTD
jgi:acyl carrier protein